MRRGLIEPKTTSKLSLKGNTDTNAFSTLLLEVSFPKHQYLFYREGIKNLGLEMSLKNYDFG